jgi:hypothetical protein
LPSPWALTKAIKVSSSLLVHAPLFTPSLAQHALLPIPPSPI